MEWNKSNYEVAATLRLQTKKFVWEVIIFRMEFKQLRFISFLIII